MRSRAEIERPPQGPPQPRPGVRLVPLGYRQAPPWTDDLARRIAHVLGGAVAIEAAPLGLESALDVHRGQYNALTLLERLIALPGSERLLGIVAGDLFIPMLTHVFGQAQLNGRGAILSTYRLDNAVYGLAPDDTLFAARLAKEAIHELGHAFGLVHCHDPDCVMHSSMYVEEIDLKREELCSDCRRRLPGAAL